jgi:RNA polymerase sigma-70 factor (ECF subfamily)
MEFTEAFDELAQLAYGMAFRVLGSRSEAEEVAQETLTKALVRWRRVQSHARPWVCRVAVNEAIGILRRRHDSQAMATGPRADGVADRVDLQRALLTLPTRQREVLILRYLLDMPEKDVARELGLSVGTVKTHSHRALAAMRVALSDEGAPNKEICDV